MTVFNEVILTKSNSKNKQASKRKNLLGLSPLGLALLPALAKADIIEGDENDNILFGTAGDDTINGYGGNDWLFGGKGDDRLHGREGNDKLFGGEGSDNISGDEGNDWLFGGDGEDRLNGNDGNDRLFGGDDDDRLMGHEGDDTLYGNQGDDFLHGSEGNDNLYGGSGDDKLIGSDGADRMYGGRGDDDLTADPADTKIDGGRGHDTLKIHDTSEITLGDYNISNIEIIDLSDGQQVNIGSRDVREVTDWDNTLIIEGSEENYISLDTEKWQQGDDVEIGENNYQSFEYRGQTLLVQEGIPTDFSDPELNLIILDGAGAEFDLGELDLTYDDVDVIDYTGSGNNYLSVDAEEILAITDDDNTLRLIGDVGDFVGLGGIHEWTAGDDEEIEGEIYNTYSHTLSDANLLIHEDIVIPIA